MTKVETPIIQYKKGRLSKKKLLALYNGLVKPRMIEEKMLLLLRQGKISKWFSGIGQEAIAVGVGMALESDEIIFPMHRNLGVFTSREVPLTRLFGQWQGKLSGFTKGRDRSFHFGTLEYATVGMISHLGPQLSLAAGVGLAHKLKGEQKVSVAFTGEGGTSEGEFHEALNVAAVWQLPVIFLVENNGYGLSTPTSEQYNCAHISDKGIGYGMKSLRIDGNNIIEVYQTISKLAKELRVNPEPVLLECVTFRQRGHEEASGVKYVPKELMNYWKERDPVHNFEQFLLAEGLIDEQYISNLQEGIKTEINEAIAVAFAEEVPVADVTQELTDLYQAHDAKAILPATTVTKEIRFIDAITEALDMGMERYEDLVLMGQDIADYGGVFKITNGFLDKYGAGRVRNTPICESAIIGVGLGLSLKGMKAMVEMQFADFVSCGFNQIVNNLAKLHYRWGANADVVVRMPCGGSVGAGPFHSQTNEAKANLVQKGTQASIITYGLGVKWAKEVAEKLGLSLDILDLRSLAPLDYEAIAETVKKTNRVLLLHEDTLVGGIGAELSAYIAQHLFKHLDAPVMRVASMDTPIPFAKTLEKQFLPVERLEMTLQELINY